MRKESEKASGKERGNKPEGQANANAVDMLKADHDKVKDLFAQCERSSEGEQEGLAQQIFQELEVHAALEEEIFYPAVRDQIDPEDLVAIEDDEEDEDSDEGEDVESNEELGEGVIAVAYEEHKAVKELIRELRQMGSKGEQFKEKFAELKEDVLDHVSEEEDVIFPAALLKLDVAGLGAQMQKRKMDLMSAAANR
ncbi:MAG TPA: hemerythrin domain-containing protein [Nitrospiraceae bacterium]|nr:hemerythrin domain-containing protein [Nitrospiraceae bacterium]